ncbi:MAG: transposase, partial [Lachnospiraceae bacterium]|nr:transposase [Lachnospiraceae bacterium]
YKNEDTKDLSIRKWICPKCNNEHDRDINAAINIRNEGMRYLSI